MQKIARRVATAERVAAKRQKTKSVKVAKKWRVAETMNQARRAEKAVEQIEETKQSIRDDWAMGPIAPRTDYGEWHHAHGAIGDVRYGNGIRYSRTILEARSKWAGGIKHLNLAEGDRVVLLEGPDKGRIGSIQRVDLEAAEVTIRDLNKSNIRIPEFGRANEDSPITTSIELPLPVSSVRLVHPITDPATGVTKDVIINQLVSSGAVTDRLTGTRRWDRIVPGLNISIPWPEKKEADLIEYSSDTLRIDVEEKTFVPTLLRPPMPEAIIDELRGRYSRFRTRHEPEYIAKLEAEEKKVEDRAQLMDSMRTPLQELHREERKTKKRKGKPRLTLEMLERIGEVIAKNRERTLNAARASDAALRLPRSGASTSVPPPPVPTTTATESPAPLPST